MTKVLLTSRNFEEIVCVLEAGAHRNADAQTDRQTRDKKIDQDRQIVV